LSLAAMAFTWGCATRKGSAALGEAEAKKEEEAACWAARVAAFPGDPEQTG